MSLEHSLARFATAELDRALRDVSRGHQLPPIIEAAAVCGLEEELKGREVCRRSHGQVWSVEEDLRQQISRLSRDSTQQQQ